MPDRGLDRTPALAIVRTIRTIAVNELPYLQKRSNDPDTQDMIDLLEEIVHRTDRWKKKAKPRNKP